MSVAAGDTAGGVDDDGFEIGRFRRREAHAQGAALGDTPAHALAVRHADRKLDRAHGAIGRENAVALHRSRGFLDIVFHGAAMQL